MWALCFQHYCFHRLINANDLSRSVDVEFASCKRRHWCFFEISTDDEFWVRDEPSRYFCRRRHGNQRLLERSVLQNVRPDICIALYDSVLGLVHLDPSTYIWLVGESLLWVLFSEPPSLRRLGSETGSSVQKFDHRSLLCEWLYRSPWFCSWVCAEEKVQSIWWLIYLAQNLMVK